MAASKMDNNERICAACGYKRKREEIKRRHRCPKCDEPYFFRRSKKTDILSESNVSKYNIEDIELAKILAFVIFTYALACIILDDVYIPAKHGGIHFHGVQAWLVFLSLWSVSYMLVCFVVLEEGRVKSKLFSFNAGKISVYSAILFFALAICYESIRSIFV